MVSAFPSGFTESLQSCFSLFDFISYISFCFSLHIPQCFFASSFTFYLVLSRQFMFSRQWRVGFLSSHFLFCGFAVRLLGCSCVSISQFHFGNGGVGPWSWFAFWCLMGPVPWVTPLHTQHNDSAARSHTGTEETKGRPSSVPVCIRIRSFFSQISASRF